MGELSAPVVVLRVTVRAPDLDAFITRYSRHIAGDRIFIFSKAPQPVGTNVRFGLQLTSGEVLLQGKGTVKRVQKDTGDTRHPPGMEVQFKPLDERSATLVDFMMATRAGLTESVVAKAAPVARALVPPKPPALARPTPLPPLPKIGKQPTPSKPHAVSPPAAAAPTVPPAAPPTPPSAAAPTAPQSPSGPIALPPPPASLAGLSSLPPLPKPSLATLSSLPSGPSAAKPSATRPPSLSLETAWKSEAPEAAAEAAPTFVEKPPGESSSTPIDTSQSASAPITIAESPIAVAGSPVSAVVAAAAAEAAAAEAAAAAPPADPSPSKPNELGTIIPPTADPSINAPPVFAESWGGDAPANPFSDVSDGAIEYFVEWSIEQSIGPRALPQSRYSDVQMALPGETDTLGSAAARRRRLAQLAGLFAAGMLVGGLGVGIAMRHGSLSAKPIAAVEAPAAVAPTTPPPEPKPAPAAAGGEAELVVTTRPPGATVTIDGNAAGPTPLTTHVAGGRHEIQVAKERYATTTTTTDAPGKVALDLRRPPATLHVTSTPPAADVTIGGEHRGKTPVDVRLPGYESYEVRVALAGARPWRKTVYLSHASNRIDAALAVGKQPAATQRSGRR